MKTKDQLTKEFTAELHALLAKYGAEIDAEDHYSGYPECGSDVRMTVTIPAIHDANGETLREWTEIDLGKWVHSS